MLSLGCLDTLVCSSETHGCSTGCIVMCQYSNAHGAVNCQLLKARSFVARGDMDSSASFEWMVVSIY